MNNLSCVKYVLFDAANTLIHKPLLWDRMQSVLNESGYDIPLSLLHRQHKMISEIIFFPDRTSEDFYNKFNSELLYSLGIIPGESMLKKIFDACTYLPWDIFNDVTALKSIELPLGIISNFSNRLPELVDEFFGNKLFNNILVSEKEGIAKPKLEFYNYALEVANVPASQILYIGDSIKLDMEPALKLGMRAVLIDRDNIFPFYSNRISSLCQINDCIDRYV
jgi:putative hydrolase of the HAD superfamily